MVHLLATSHKGREYPGSWAATSLSGFCSLMSRNLAALAVLVLLALPIVNHDWSNIVTGVSIVLLLLAAAAILHEGQERWCEAIYRRQLLRHQRQPREQRLSCDDHPI